MAIYLAPLGSLDLGYHISGLWPDEKWLTSDSPDSFSWRGQACPLSLGNCELRFNADGREYPQMSANKMLLGDAGFFELASLRDALSCAAYEGCRCALRQAQGLQLNPSLLAFIATR